MLSALALSTLLTLPAAAQVPGAAPDYPVGKRSINARGAQAFPIALWYPLAAAGDANTPAAGRFPLVLFSHGSGGSERNQHGWAEHLARRGYVVATSRHWGDSYDQPGGRGTDVQLIGRPLQAAAALDGACRSLHQPVH